MYLIVSEYKDNRQFYRYIWWGKGKHYHICHKNEKPTNKWVGDFCMLELPNVERKINKLPSNMWIDGRAFTLKQSKIIEV